MKRRLLPLVLVGLGLLAAAHGQDTASPTGVTFNVNLESQNFGAAINIFLLLTALTLAPSFIMMMTSFLRTAVVLAFLRQALGVQQSLSGKTIASLALFMTVFIMQPVYMEIYRTAIEPYSEKQIDQRTAIENAAVPIRAFMLKHVRESSLLLFMELGGIEAVRSPDELPMRVVIPAFMLSELKTAFQMGFLLYLPFLVIDVVVATILMSMGMFMLPPMMISLPFKLLLFIMFDGWVLLMRTLVTSFY